jgi:actin related protein 2/3 complex subunit 1A/1B
MHTLPLVTLAWTSEDTVIAAGHDCRPFVFSGSQNGWQETGTLDDATASKSPESRFGAGSPTVGRLKAGAFATFRDADTRGQSGSSDTKMNSFHQNTITSIRPYEHRGGNVTKVSTSGVDGALIIWEVNAVTATGQPGSSKLR